MPGPDDPTLPGDDLTIAGVDHAPQAPDTEPRHVSRDRYRLGATLGEGGMAVVVEAQDTNLNRPVAIKQLRDELRLDANIRRRFFHEAEILAGLDHAGLVAVHDVDLRARHAVGADERRLRRGDPTRRQERNRFLQPRQSLLR